VDTEEKVGSRVMWLTEEVPERLKEESAMVNVKTPSLRGYLIKYGNIQRTFQLPFHGSANILWIFTPISAFDHGRP
jgi:hypothetical protein